MINVDKRTVESFGDEWRRFDQSNLPEEEALKVFNEYFSVFPWEELPPDATGFDMGCGTGRWARFVAPRVAHLHCIDPSLALDQARSNLSEFGNVSYHRATSQDRPLPRESQDFGYSLGVLHHIPDTAQALADCVSMLKPGAPFLVYLYYAFDNRPIWFRALWRLSDALRRAICRLPSSVKGVATDVIAALVYLPLARTARFLSAAGINVDSFPLSYYRDHSFYTLRTDSRDRFGTPLERRFSRAEILRMMRGAGLANISFSDRAPYWCAMGRKA
jgi:Methylase involved in ubiquinone/menaquinone biosynthesis